MAQQSISVAVADLQPVMTEGVRAVLGTTGEFQITAAVNSLGEIRALSNRIASVLLVNRCFGQKPILAFLEQIKSQSCAPAVVIWGLQITEADTARWLQAGAMGVIAGSASPSDLVAGIRAVARGIRHIDPAIFHNFDPRVRLPRCTLTRREQEILACIRRGIPTNRSIGSELGIKPGTVKVHVKRIMTKTGIRGRHALAIADFELTPLKTAAAGG